MSKMSELAMQEEQLQIEKKVEKIYSKGLKSIFTEGHLEILKYFGSNPVINYLDLEKKTKKSKPLLSYYLNGNLKMVGLREYGLIEELDLAENRHYCMLNGLNRGNSYFRITKLGIVMLKNIEDAYKLLRAIKK